MGTTGAASLWPGLISMYPLVTALASSSTPCGGYRCLGGVVGRRRVRPYTIRGRLGSSSTGHSWPTLTGCSWAAVSETRVSRRTQHGWRRVVARGSCPGYGERLEQVKLGSALPCCARATRMLPLIS